MGYPYMPGYGAPMPYQPQYAQYNLTGTAQQPQGGPQSGPDWIMAPSIKQVEQISVQPGQKAWVMVQNEPVFALRMADNMGLVTTDYYRFEKIDPNTTGLAPNSDYITRQEFNAFVESLKGKKDGAG